MSKKSKTDSPLHPPTKDEMNDKVNLSITPKRLAQAVLKGGAPRREIEESKECRT